MLLNLASTVRHKTMTVAGNHAVKPFSNWREDWREEGQRADYNGAAPIRPVFWHCGDERGDQEPDNRVGERHVAEGAETPVDAAFGDQVKARGQVLE